MRSFDMSYKKIKLEPQWTLEVYQELTGNWVKALRKEPLDDSLEECVRWWNEFSHHTWGPPNCQYRIRNTDTDEVIPCAALT